MAGNGGSNPPVVKPVRAPTGRTIDWRALVAMAEGDDYRARQHYAVYVFGGGQQRRVFTEEV